jgi:hypothetical protein
MMRMAAVLVLMLALGAGGAAQVDVSTLGPQVGERAPAFRLTDQFGRERTLDSVAGPKGTMLVFFRSATW